MSPLSAKFGRDGAGGGLQAGRTAFRPSDAAGRAPRGAAPALSARRPSSGARSGGFTLLELLVAVSLTVLMLGIALGMLGQLINLSTQAASTAELDQNLRAAANLITQDLTMAAANIPIGGISLPSGKNSTVVKRPGACCNDFPTNGGVLSALTPGYGLGPAQTASSWDTSYSNGTQTSSDEITMISVDPLWISNNPSTTQCPSPLTLAAINSAGTQITFNACANLGSGANQLQVGDLVLLENSIGNAMGMVTAMSGDVASLSAGDAMNLNQPTAADGNIVSLGTGNPITYPDTSAYRMVMITYYLDFSNPSLPRLMRQVNDNTAMPVADFITGLQFSYDLSTGTENDQRTVTEPNEIRQVNLVIAARSQQAAARSSQYYTNSIATAVAIRSLEFRNRYQ